MERLSLNGKVAIVTGSSSGIGRAIAALFVRRGAKVVIHGRDVEKLDKVKKELAQNGQVTAVAGDVRDEPVRNKLVDTAVSTYGQLDILVNVAGAPVAKFIRDLTQKDLDDMYNIYFKVPVSMSQIVLPHLIKAKGNIVNISSGFSIEVVQSFMALGAAYSANDTFVRYAAVEFGHAGVRVNSVRIGVIKTPGNECIPEEVRDEVLGAFARGAIQNRLGSPEEVAEAVAYLASDAASFVTGAILDVDGGRLVYRDRDGKGQEPKYDDLVGQS